MPLMNWGSAVNAGKARAATLLTAFFSILLILAWCLTQKFPQVSIQTENFRESPRQLDNPNRGFYCLLAFQIADEPTDYNLLLDEMMKDTSGTSLSLVEINLQNYRDCALTSAALTNIDNLFVALKHWEKQLIVRFLYDWDGKNLEQEPENLDLILTHMEQLEYVLREHSQSIFTLQGLFVGHWGEMHGTAYSSTEDFRVLAEKLAAVTDPATYLAVRTPAQWRAITGQGTPGGLTGLAARLGLFNDGMLGNESDWGTYHTSGESLGRRSRREELDFQRQLSLKTPNGGEIIIDNPYNDFEAAVDALNTMGVTYLNRDYDREVLEKWEQTTIWDGSCYNGLNGLEYIQCHLGYRLFISQASLSYDWISRSLEVEIQLKNTGFSPLYREPKVQIRLLRRADGHIADFDLPQELRRLAGGGREESPVKYSLHLSLADWEKGRYALYFSLTDTHSGQSILLANEQDQEDLGYLIGSLELS